MRTLLRQSCDGRSAVSGASLFGWWRFSFAKQAKKELAKLVLDGMLLAGAIATVSVA